MTWFKIDDSYYDHPKVFDAPDCAVALWTRAGAWAARNLTDGFVPSGMPARLCDDPDTALRELVRRGLWSRASGGYQFHDWHVYQPSAASVKELREKRAAAGKAGGQAKARKQTPSKGLASARRVAKQTATPTRPPLKGEGRPGVAREETEGVSNSPMSAADARAAIRATTTAASARRRGDPCPDPADPATPAAAPPPTVGPTGASAAANASPPPTHPDNHPPSTTGHPQQAGNRPPSAQDPTSSPAPAATPPPASETATPAAGRPPTTRKDAA